MAALDRDATDLIGSTSWFPLFHRFLTAANRDRIYNIIKESVVNITARCTLALSDFIDG